MSLGSMLATVGAWSFVTMIAIAVVVFVGAEGRWMRPKDRSEPAEPEHLIRSMLSGRLFRRMGWCGWLLWLGMWCGIVGAASLFVGVPWAAREERAEREARRAAENDLVRRLCGDLPIIPPSRRVLDGIAREDPEVRNEVARLWRENSDCRARALGREPLTRDGQEGRTDSTFARQPARRLPF